MGLDDQPAHAVWRDWTAQPDTRLVPKSFVDQVVAFDYWQIGDEDFIEDAWAGASAVLDYARREGLSDEQEHTDTLLLEALDSRQGPGDKHMDVTYVVSLDQKKPVEGLVVRFFEELPDKHVAPGLSIYLGRAEGASGGFDRAVMWAVPRFKQAQAFTIALHKTDKGWVAHKFDGAAYPAEAGPEEASKNGSLKGVADLATSIFTNKLWTPLTGANYVEAKPKAAEGKERALPKDVPAALGLEVRERQIEETYQDTVFPPRVEVPPMGGTSAP